jgi:short subunit dehydrogenase-like uncharacterized protein
MKATMNRTQTRLLLYGAYGFTGRLAPELAAARKLDMAELDTRVMEMLFYRRRESE